MGLLKKLVIVFFVSVTMLAVATPSAMAKVGKQANQTQAGVAIALDDTVAAAEALYAHLQEGIDDVKAGLAEFKNVKQLSKTIESSTVYPQRARAQGALRKARSAFKKGHNEEAVKLMKIAVEKFKTVKSDYYSFEGD